MAYLLDYEGKKYELNPDAMKDVSDIVLARITVYTGDEELLIVYKDGHTFEDSTYSAWQMCFDGSYDIIVNGKWVVDEDTWNSRETSYWWFEFDE